MRRRNFTRLFGLPIAFSLKSCVKYDGCSMNLRHELEKRSRDDGLALLALRSGSANVIALDGGRTVTLKLLDLPALMCESSYNNGFVGFVPPGPVRELRTAHDGQIVAVRLDGGSAGRLPGPFTSCFGLAYAPRQSLIALAGVYKSRDGLSLEGLQVWRLEAQSGELLLHYDPRTDGPEMPKRLAWSPDAEHLVYERKSSIYMFHLQSRLERRLAIGDRPSWAPDGSWISYVNHEHSLTLLNPASFETRTVLRGRSIQGRPAWSPDSKYLAFGLAWGGSGTKLSVCRLSDEAACPIQDAGKGIGDELGWATGQRANARQLL